MTWLVEHTAWILTSRLRGGDGKTAHQRVRGRPCVKRTVEFGESVLYKLPMKGPKADERATLDPRWAYGLMLGYARYTNEDYFWTGDKVAKTSALMRLKSNTRWHSEQLENVDIDVQRCEWLWHWKSRSFHRR